MALSGLEMYLSLQSGKKPLAKPPARALDAGTEPSQQLFQVFKDSVCLVTVPKSSKYRNAAKMQFAILPPNSKYLPP